MPTHPTDTDKDGRGALGSVTMTVEADNNGNGHSNPFQHLPDVDGGNVDVMHTGLERLGRDPAALYEGLPADRSPESVRKGKLPLWMYSIVERNLYKMLGDPAASVPFVLRAAIASWFGQANYWLMRLLARTVRFVMAVGTSPAVVFAQIVPVVAMLLNLNKVESAVSAGPFRTRMRTVPRRFAGMILRRPETDVSRKWWKPGFTASFLAYWLPDFFFKHIVIDYSVFDHFELFGEFVDQRQALQSREQELLMLDSTGSEVPTERVVAQRCRLYREPGTDSGTAFYTVLDPVTAYPAELAGLLVQLPGFQKLSGAERSSIVAASRVQHLAAGEELFAAGELAKHLFVVLAGQLNVHVQPAKLLNAGSVAGEVGCFADQATVRAATVEASTESWVLRVPYVVLQKHRAVLQDSFYQKLASYLSGVSAVIAGQSIAGQSEVRFAAEAVQFLTDNRQGWKVVQDLHVRAPDGHAWTICEDGEVYCQEAGCGLVDYHYRPSNLLRRGLFMGQWTLYRHWYLTLALLATLVWSGTMFDWRFYIAAPVLVPALLTRALLPVVRRILLSIQEKGSQDWLMSELKLAQRQAEDRDREVFWDRRTAREASFGGLRQVSVPHGLVVAADLEGFTSRTNQAGEEAVVASIEGFTDAVVDWDANPDIAAGELAEMLVFGQATSTLLNTAGDGYYVGFFNAEISDLVRQALEFAFYLHDAAEATVLPEADLNAMALRVGIAPGGWIFRWFGRKNQAGRRVLARRSEVGAAINFAARLEATAKSLRKQLKAATGQDANRMTLLPMDLWQLVADDSRWQVEDLGEVLISDFGRVHLVRVLDDKSAPVTWPADLLPRQPELRRRPTS